MRDISANIQEFINGKDGLGGIKPLEHYSSFDYCFNYFQKFRESNTEDRLVDKDNLELSCQHLGFF